MRMDYLASFPNLIRLHVLFLLLSIPLFTNANCITPPQNIGKMVENAEFVVYGKIVGHINGNSKLNNFEVIQVLKGASLSTGQIIRITEAGSKQGEYVSDLAGDIDYEIGKNYLIFMHQLSYGFYTSDYRSMSVFEENVIDDEIILSRINRHGQIVYNLSSPDKTGYSNAYLKDPFLNHLSDVAGHQAKWSVNKTSLFIPSEKYQEEIALINDQLHNDYQSSRAPCPNAQPCHCATVAGDLAGPHAAYVDNNWTVCVAGGASDDPTRTNELTLLQDAIAALNCMPGINVTYLGVDATCNAAAWAGDIRVADATLSCAGGFGMDCNKVMVYFDDPFNEVMDVTGPGNCSGVQGFGGAWRGGTHMDVCGNTWETHCNPYFVMNNFGPCAPSTPSDYSYTATLTHELLHAFGIGHHYDASAFTTTTAANDPCGGGMDIVHDGTECSGLMNPVGCSSNEAAMAPKFGITPLDEACTDWMYVITAAGCTALAGEPITTPEELCNTDAGAFDLSDKFDPATGEFDDGAGNIDPVNTNYVAVDQATGAILGVATSAATIDLSGAPVGTVACVYQLAYTQALLDDVTTFLDNLLCNTLCVPFTGPCLGDVGYCPGVTPVELAPFLDILNQFFGFDEAQICNFLDNQILTITDPTGLIGDQTIDLAANGLDFCADKSDDPYCVEIISCAECPMVAEVDATEEICDGDLATEITDWQDAIAMDATNVTALAAANTAATLFYSMTLVVAPNMPDGTEITGVYTNVMGCTEEVQTMYAYIQCYGEDDLADTADDEWLLVGTIDLTVNPPSDPPTPPVAVGCIVTLEPFCTNDVITIAAPDNATGGAAAANYSSATSTYTAQPGDVAGTIDILITNEFGCTDTEVINTPACPAAAGCTALAGEPITTPEELCDTDAGAFDLSTKFDPATGSFDDGAGNIDPVNTNYVAVDQATGEIIGVATSAATIDLSGAPVGTVACVYQLAYTQALLDDVTSFLDNLLCNTLCVPFTGPCLGDVGYCPGVTPVELAPFLDILNTFFGFNEAQICNFLDNQIITITDPTGLIGDQTIDLAANGLDFCADKSDAPYCVEIVSCTTTCTISNVVVTSDGACNGDDATFQICFDVEGGSGAYDIVDTDNANAVLTGLSGLPTDTDPATAGDEICFTLTIPGPTTSTTLNLDIVDNADAACIGGSPVVVNIPACSAAVCAIEVTCPSDPVVLTCDSADIEAAYNTWISGFGFTGGINVTDNMSALPTLADALSLSCGGSISFTYQATSTDDNGIVCSQESCNASFTVTAPSTVSVMCGTDVSFVPCDESEIEAEYNAWVSGIGSTGGCNVSDNLNDLPTLNDVLALACGGSISYTYTASSFGAGGDLCSQASCSMSFTILTPSCIPSCIPCDAGHGPLEIKAIEPGGN